MGDFCSQGRLCQILCMDLRKKQFRFISSVIFLSHRYSFTHVYHRMGAYIYLRIFIQLQNSLNLMFKVLVMPNTVMNCISIY